MLSKAVLLERRKELEANMQQRLMDANALHGAIEEIDWELSQMEEEDVKETSGVQGSTGKNS